jgi:hypothetical protein
VQADEQAEREWSSGGDSEQLIGADAATSLLVASCSDGDMLLQVGTDLILARLLCNNASFMQRQPRMTQLLATLVPAMFEAWNKVFFVLCVFFYGLAFNVFWL